MMTTEERVDELASELWDQWPTYGAPATVDLDDGRAVRLKVEPEDVPTKDLLGDVWGTVTWARQNRDGYREERPDGFDGNAEILQRDYPYVMWWQPPADGPKRGTEEFDAMRRHLRDLLDEGFTVLVVELLDEETDGYGRRVVREFAVLGGVDLVWSTLEEHEDQDQYAREVTRDLLVELFNEED